MLSKLAVAFSLMALCVVIHSAGVIAVFRRMRPRLARGNPAFGQSTARLVRIAAWTVLLHLVQIIAWATYYTLSRAMPDFTTAAYFSAVTYTTTGYGDLVLPPDWRVVGGVEALTGILMYGLSTGMYFAVFSKFLGRESTT